MAQSSIEWTESTWNPVTGCTKISAGCKNCYAERMAYRLKAMGQPNYQNGFKVTLHPQVLGYPLNWKKPQMIFVNSMSDLFHEEIPDGYILRVFEVMNKASWHTFQILTKRAERIRDLDNLLPWAPNIWMGVTVEDSDNIERINALRGCHAGIKFISFEPLLGPVGLVNLDGIDWTIVGGESGIRARAVRPEWVWQIKLQADLYDSSFFFKQWGGFNKKKKGRLLHGKTWDAMPERKMVCH